MKIILLLFILAIFKATNATLGVDLSSLTSSSSFGCLKLNGFEFAIVRCYQSFGRVDPNCASSILNAWNAGMNRVDAYMFPCFSCGNPAGQANTLVSYLKTNNVNYGMIWIDIEGPGTYWGSSQSANAAFFTDLVSAFEKEGVSIGVYTSISQWQPIMGSYSGGSKFQLWYAHYDGVTSFNDFTEFSGWSKPNIKQYLGENSLCGANCHSDLYYHYIYLCLYYSLYWYLLKNMTPTSPPPPPQTTTVSSGGATTPTTTAGNSNVNSISGVVIVQVYHPPSD
ncbi:glycoside hydrolase family 25 protein [Tieghemostelium lacteum]|uniref:lysozyme n=1 Tax=Tieghemostelium lacteum TaxID=361077 RepID=A0A151ZDE5_TIELA|nr:glycoside hydrolase family 25 protein [Tieghemostelium lacteum]|eukprot:KYQ91967.1 glycoside hydrolase family 25 protein [Tieghemostelium lacteum]